MLSFPFWFHENKCPRTEFCVSQIGLLQWKALIHVNFNTWIWDNKQHLFTLSHICTQRNGQLQVIACFPRIPTDTKTYTLTYMAPCDNTSNDISNDRKKVSGKTSSINHFYSNVWASLRVTKITNDIIKYSSQRWNNVKRIEQTLINTLCHVIATLLHGSFFTEIEIFI